MHTRGFQPRTYLNERYLTTDTINPLLKHNVAAHFLPLAVGKDDPEARRNLFKDIETTENLDAKDRSGNDLLQHAAKDGNKIIADLRRSIGLDKHKRSISGKSTARIAHHFDAEKALRELRSDYDFGSFTVSQMLKFR